MKLQHQPRQQLTVGLRGATLTLTLLLAAIGCGSDGGTDPSPVAAVEITQAPTAEVEVGATWQLAASAYDADGEPLTDMPIVWSSSNTAVATVDPSSGILTPLARGTTTITATAGGESDQTAVTVVILYRSIATGEFNSCDIASGGIVWCWGENGDNAGSTVNPVPVQLSSTLRFTQLNAGGANKCGIVGQGAAYCWGPNTDGQLGNGSTGAGSTTPVAVSGGHIFRSIVTETPNSCAVTYSNVAYCWGDNSEAIVNSASDATAPTLVPGGHQFLRVDVGQTHACGVTTTGAAYCWGSDTYGQLGDGGTISYSSADTNAAPVLVAGGHTWATVTTGQFFTCGLTTGDVAYCWGYNAGGRLGDNSTNDASSPVAVSGGLRFTRIDAGRYHTCALVVTDAAYCWGDNNLGQFGNAAPLDLSRVPVSAAGGIEFDDISASDGEHTCGITTDRKTVYCFGRNDRSQLGNNASTSSTTRNTTPVIVSGQRP